MNPHPWWEGPGVRRVVCVGAILASFVTSLAAQDMLLQKDGAAGQQARETPVDPADWEARDVEGRWALLVDSSVGGFGDLSTAWVQFLVARDERQILEWWMLTRVMSAGARDALITQDAPEWLRATVFQLGNRDSHVVDAAKKELSAHADVFLGWLALHPGAAEVFDVEVGRLAESLRRDEAREVVADTEGAERYAAPYTRHELFGALAAAPRAIPFGDRLRADDDELYDTQVERAILAAASLARPGAGLAQQLLGIAQAGSANLGQSAALGLTYFPPALIPTDALWALADDTDRPVAVREAALLAASYGPEPRPCIELLLIASDRDHTHWRAALSRLADIGDEFVNQELQRLERPGSPWNPSESTALGSERARLESRLRAMSRPQSAEKIHARVRVLAARLAWAQHERVPFAARLDAWVRYELSTLPQDAVLDALRSLADGEGCAVLVQDNRQGPIFGAAQCPAETS